MRKEASVSGSQLTHYFVDKPALIRAVLDRQIELVLDFHRQPSLGGLLTFDDFERWLDLNMRYLRKIGYTKTPTYHTLVGQLAKSDDATRQTLADGYRRWIDLVEHALQQMKDRGALVTSADPHHLALVVVGGHQGAGTMTFAYRQPWPLADEGRFVVNYLRTFAADPAEQIARSPRRPRNRRTRVWTAHRGIRAALYSQGAGDADSNRRAGSRAGVRARGQRDEPRRCAKRGERERVTARALFRGQA